MILHLENKEKQLTINLNFTRFFGQKHGIYSVQTERQQKQKLLTKYLIEYFAPTQEKGIQMVKNWFLQALKEMNGKNTIDGQYSILNESYERFRKDYKLDSPIEINQTIRKMNTFKVSKKTTVLRTELSECIGLLLTADFSLYHFGDNQGLSISIPEGLLEDYEGILKRKYYNIIGNFKSNFFINLSELKIYDFLKYKNFIFNIKDYFTFFNSKEKISISTYNDEVNGTALISVVLKQDNNILLVNGFESNGFEDEDFTILNIHD